MSLTAYYRTFLKEPFLNADIHQGGSRSAIQCGGKMNRFGGPLSGNCNPNFLFGCPTGGTDATSKLVPSVRDKYFVGGKRRKSKRGRGVDTLSDATGPGSIKSPYHFEYGVNGTIRSNSSSKLMDQMINPSTFHMTSPIVGSTIY